MISLVELCEKTIVVRCISDGFINDALPGVHKFAELCRAEILSQRMVIFGYHALAKHYLLPSGFAEELVLFAEHPP